MNRDPEIRIDVATERPNQLVAVDGGDVSVVCFLDADADRRDVDAVVSDLERELAHSRRIGGEPA